MNFITYILYSQSLSKYYTGHTQDLQKRLQEHNAGQTASIKNGIPWKIVWTAELSLRSNFILALLAHSKK